MSPSDAMLTFADQMGSVQQLVMMLSYLIGFVMAGVGLYQIATGGGGRGQYAHGLGMGITLLFVGALALNFAVTISALVATTYGDGAAAMDALSSVPRHANPMHTWIAAIFNVLIVIGWIFGIWGLVNLGIAGSRRETGLGPGLSRLVAAVFLTNPYLFVRLLGSSVGQQGAVSIILPSP